MHFWNLSVFFWFLIFFCFFLPECKLRKCFRLKLDGREWLFPTFFFLVFANSLLKSEGNRVIQSVNIIFLRNHNLDIYVTRGFRILISKSSKTLQKNYLSDSRLSHFHNFVSSFPCITIWQNGGLFKLCSKVVVFGFRSRPCLNSISGINGEGRN